MHPDHASSRVAFRDAATAFVSLVTQIAPEAWEQPALGVWNVRDLVGHTSRSLTTIETYLGTATAGDELDGPLAYFLAIRAALADPEAVAQRGRDAGAALGDDPVGRVRDLADRVIALVESSPDDAPVGTPVAPMTLAAYLPTRIFELTVHSLDLARALSLGTPPGLEAGIRVSCELAGQLAAEAPHAPAALLALTGRTGLPDGFTVL